MQITFLRDGEAFVSVSEAWNGLLSTSATNVPFLRHEYLKAWWTTLGGGEWDSGELWIGAGRDARGALIGVAPLFSSSTPDGRRALMFLGTHEIVDYLDFIYSPESGHAFIDALLEALTREGPQVWRLLDLYNIPEQSPTLTTLEAQAEKRGWRYAREILAPCPVASLQGGWQDYLARLDKKQRHELRRKIRRAEAQTPDLRYTVVETGDDIERATDDFLDLMAHDPKKLSFLTEKMRQQFHDSVRAAHEAGWLHLSFLKVGAQFAAGYLNFDYDNRLWIYNSGMNPAYNTISPGWVLLGYLIRWAAESGRGEIDFMRGDEEYKYRLGGVDRSIVRITIERSG